MEMLQLHQINSLNSTNHEDIAKRENLNEIDGFFRCIWQTKIKDEINNLNRSIITNNIAAAIKSWNKNPGLYGFTVEFY